MFVFLLFLFLIIPSTGCGAEVPGGGGRDDPSNHVHLGNPGSKITYHWYSSVDLAPESANFAMEFKNNTLFVHVELAFCYFTGRLIDGCLEILSPDLSEIVLDFSVPPTFLNDSCAQFLPIDFPAHLPSPLEHNYNNWTVVVASAKIRLRSFHSIGTFITQNFARATYLAVEVEDSISKYGDIVTVADEDIFRGLGWLKYLTYSHIVIDNSGEEVLISPTFDDMRLLPPYPTVLAGIESTRLIGLVVYVKGWNVAQWNFSLPAIGSLESLNIRAAALPLPDAATFDELREEGEYAKDQCEYLDLSITLQGCSATHLSPLYLDTLCDSQYMKNSGKKHLQARSLVWGVIFGRTCIHVKSIEASCPTPFRIPEGCLLLDNSELAIKEDLTISGFVVDGYVVSAVNRARGLYFGTLKLLNILWDTTDMLNITLFEFTMEIHTGNSTLLSVSSSPVLDLGVLCGECPCHHFSVNGGENNSNPPVVTFRDMVKFDDNHNAPLLRDCQWSLSKQSALMAPSKDILALSHVHVEENVWKRVSASYNYHISKLHLVQLRGPVNFWALFPCAVDIDGSSNYALTEDIARQGVCGSNSSSSRSFPMQELVIESRNETIFPFYFSEDLFISHPKLENLQFTNVRIESFELRSDLKHFTFEPAIKTNAPSHTQLQRVSFVNAKITSPLRALHVNGADLKYSLVDTPSVFLNGSIGKQFNFSHNHISTFDLRSVAVSTLYYNAMLGVHTLVLSHNILTDFHMTVFQIMDYSNVNYFGSGHYSDGIGMGSPKLIDLSYNRLSSVNISHDLPPPGYVGMRNLTSPAMRGRPNMTYADFKREYIQFQTLQIDLSHTQ
eukprot:Nk52_evm11s160 gene=Nk52_evmTU11s160